MNLSSQRSISIRASKNSAKTSYGTNLWHDYPAAWWQAHHVHHEVVKQEITRVNINILRISELKWNGMGEFNSDDHYIYYGGQESLRRNGVAIMVNKRVQNAVAGCSLKNYRMISVRFQGKQFNITVIQVYAPTSNTEEAEQFYEDLQDLLDRKSVV